MSIPSQIVTITAPAVDQPISHQDCLPDVIRQPFLKQSLFDIVTPSGAIIASSLCFHDALLLKRSLTDNPCMIKFIGMEALS